MGTRSLVSFFQYRSKEGKYDGRFCTLYRQFDGYPRGMGKDLKDILSGKTIVNGFGSDTSATYCYNGMGCLTASVIKELKKGIGNVYICDHDETTDAGQEYFYAIYPLEGKKGEIPTGKIGIDCYAGRNMSGGLIYSGDIDDFDTSTEEYL